MSGTLDNVPACMKAAARWVMWHTTEWARAHYQEKPDETPEAREKGIERLAKTPYNVHKGSPASSTDPATWATFLECSEAVGRDGYGGVGFALGGGWCGVDLDHVRDGGALTCDAAEIVRELDTYTEVSPSGTGVHCVLTCDLDILMATQRRTRNSLPHGGIETYWQGRYFRITGDVLEPAERYGEVQERTTRLLGVHCRYVCDAQPLPRPTEPEPTNETNRSTAEVLARMFSGKRGGDIEALFNGRWQDYRNADGQPLPSQSEADMALCSHAAYYSGCDAATVDEIMRESGLFRPDKWDVVHTRGKTYGEATVEAAILSTHPAAPKSERRASARRAGDMDDLRAASVGGRVW